MVDGRLDGNPGNIITGGPEKSWKKCVEDDLKLLEIRGDRHDEQSRNPAEWYQTVEEGAGKFMQTWISKQKTMKREKRHKEKADKEEHDPLTVIPLLGILYNDGGLCPPTGVPR